jgi:hypothetical protein
MIRIFLISLALLLLTACGPTLFTVGGILNVTAGDVAVAPIKHKILSDLKEDLDKKPSKTAER